MAIRKITKVLIAALTFTASLTVFPITLNSATASYGGLDTTFGGNGTGYSYLSAEEPGMVSPLRGDRLKQSALDSQERIVVVGTTIFDGGDQSALTIARFNQDGSIDSSFGPNQNGFVSLQIGVEDVFETVGIQSDGKIVAAGFTDDGSTSRWMVARFLPTGVLDTTFGVAGTGFIVENFGLSAAAKSLAVLANDELIIAGSSNVDPADPANFLLPTFTKYDRNGNKDLGFGRSGIGWETYTVGTEGAEIKAIKTLNNGDVIGVGNTLGVTQKPLIVSLSSSGILNLNFGGHNSGFDTTTASITSSEFSSIAILTTGKILAAGSLDASTMGLVARYNSNGTLDNSFGVANDGFVRLQALDQTVFNDLEIASNNSFAVGGYSVANINGDYKFLIAKYREDGSLDTTFSSQSGYFLENISTNDEVISISLNSAQEIIFAGQSFGPSSNKKLLLIGKLLGNVGPNVSPSSNVTSVPDPIQQSVIETVTVIGEKATSIILSGKFPEPIVNVLLNQEPIEPSEWRQTPVSVTISDVAPGNYVVQIFNGAVPLLPEQKVSVVKVTAPTPTPTPAAQETTAPTPPTTVETPSVVTGPAHVKAFKVYFAMASAKLEESSKEVISAWFEEFGSKAQMLKITGYAQATPKGASLDPALSARRARAVKNFFIELGYTGKFRTSGAGRTPLNRAESRYVEVATP